LRLGRSALACINQHQQGPGRANNASGCSVMVHVIHEGGAPIKAWIDGVPLEDAAKNGNVRATDRKIWTRVAEPFPMSQAAARARLVSARISGRFARLFDIVKTEPGCGSFVAVRRRGHEGSPQRRGDNERVSPSATPFRSLLARCARGKTLPAMILDFEDGPPRLCASAANLFGMQEPPPIRTYTDENLPCSPLFFAMACAPGIAERSVVAAFSAHPRPMGKMSPLLLPLLAGEPR